jgi:hypothetical protein
MKALLFLFLFTSFISHLGAAAKEEDQQFIAEAGLQIKTGYGNTSMHYFSYDRDDLGQSYKFKKNKCYLGKINKFKKTIKRLEKEGFTFTSTETYINQLPNGNGQVATFLVTYVKDTYQGDWAFDEGVQDSDGGPRARPADYLIYRFVHFECDLKQQTQINSSARKEGKDLQRPSFNKKSSGKTKLK